MQNDTIDSGFLRLSKILPKHPCDPSGPVPRERLLHRAADMVEGFFSTTTVYRRQIQHTGITIQSPTVHSLIYLHLHVSSYFHIGIDYTNYHHIGQHLATLATSSPSPSAQEVIPPGYPEGANPTSSAAANGQVEDFSRLWTLQRQQDTLLAYACIGFIIIYTHCLLICLP